MGKEHGIRIGTEVVYPTQKYCEIKKKIQLFLFLIISGCSVNFNLDKTIHFYCFNIRNMRGVLGTAELYT